MSKNFSSDRIRAGLLHFAIGKVFSSIAGFLAIILIVRNLPVHEFAVYAVLFALVEYFTAVSGFGIQHLAARYIPQLYLREAYNSLRYFVKSAIAARFACLAIVGSITYFFAEPLASALNITGAENAFRFFCVLGIVRAATHFMSLLLESTLHQGWAQFAFSLASLLKLIGIYYLAESQQVSLMSVLYVEAASDAVALLVMALAFFTSIKTQSPNQEDDGLWLQRNITSLIPFARSAYLQHLANLPFGSNTNRILVSSLGTAPVAASFGYSQLLYEYLKRYLPAQLLVGMIRPIIIARYEQTGRFDSVTRLSSGVFLINYAILGLPIVIISSFGTEVLSFISAGKYGEDAAMVLFLMLFVLLLETSRLQLELMTQAVERYNILFWSNILLSLSAGLGILLYDLIGAASFPAANIVALLFSNIWVRRRLRMMGFEYKENWRPIVKVSTAISIACIFGIAFEAFHILHWFYSAIVSSLIYLLLVDRLSRQEIVQSVKAFTSKH